MVEPRLDKVPGFNLYIGGFISLRRNDALRAARITHILSIIDWPVSPELVQHYRHLQININDMEDENLLEHFPTAIAFIQEGLQNINGHAGVLIHCAMGKSRSATILLAYLLHATRHFPAPSATPSPPPSPAPLFSYSGPPKPPIPARAPIDENPPEYRLSPSSALKLLRQGHPLAEPNEGFTAQLDLYYAMGCPTTDADLDNHPEYQRWLYRRIIQDSLDAGQAPKMEEVRFEDEATNTAPSSFPSTSTKIRCRKCRTVLADSRFIIPHIQKSPKPPSSSTPAPPCGHIFLHPLSWMRPALSTPSDSDTHNPPPPTISFTTSSDDDDDDDNNNNNTSASASTPGPLSGRLTCPNTAKCGNTNIGKFAWQGMKCTCGEWVTPAFALARGRVDEQQEGKGVGIRQPVMAGGGGGSDNKGKM
ncbi:MAG: hypothetical protein Q9227_000856 [Pyrenula ochraceoflavens]